MKIIRPIIIVNFVTLFFLWLSACTSPPTIQTQAFEVLGETEQPTITPTPIWFPVTTTPSPLPLPTQEPTSEKRTGLGNIVLEDQFANKDSWSIYSDNDGSVAYGNDSLTLSISEPNGQLSSYRKDTALNNFYLEMTTQANLCLGEDNYGIIFRTNSEFDYYRLLISCNGLVRLERLNNAKIALLQNWTPSGQVPIGSPVQLKIGVWAFNNEFRIFINDIYQFTANDPVWVNGGLGVFTRSVGENALSVSFSNLTIYDLSDEMPPLNETSFAPEATQGKT